MTSVRRSLIGLAVFSLVAAGCSGEERPQPETWLPTWEAATAVIPERSQLGDPPDATLCNETLVRVRELRGGLFPTPSLTVDDLVTDWVSVAETAFFECPPQGAQIGSFDQAYEELNRIEESVVTALGDG